MLKTESLIPAYGQLVKKIKPFDVFGFLSRYLLLTIVIGSFVFAMLLPLILKFSVPLFEATGVLKIDPVIPSLITKSEDPSIINYFHDYARTQARRIGDHEVLIEAIKKLTPAERNSLFPPQMPDDHCANLLGIWLKIRPISRTHLISLSLQGRESEGLPIAINHVMSVYLEKIRREIETKHEDRLDYLKAKRQQLLDQIESLESLLKNNASEIMTASFSEDFNLEHQKVQNLQKQYVQLLTERVQAENKLSEQKKLQDRISKLSMAPMVSEKVMSDQSIDFTSSWTYQELQKMRASIDGITKENNDRKYIERRMQAMRDYESQLLEETEREADFILNGKRDYDLTSRVIKAQEHFQAAKDSEEQILHEIEQARDRSKLYSVGILKAESLKTELTHHRDLLFRIDTRIHELLAESKAPLRVQIESRARKPHSPSSSNTMKLIMALFAFAFGSVGGVFFLLELFDNRIRSPKNIEHAIGVPPTWPISQAAHGQTLIDSLRLHAESQPATAIRSLAVRLHKEYINHQSQVLMFGGVGPGVGTSEIMLHTAIALSYLVPKVLLIEGNHLAPKLNTLLEASGDTSANECSSWTARSTSLGVDVITFNRIESIKDYTRGFAEHVEALKQDYDIICVDSAPLMNSALSEYLAVWSDLTVLISQGDSTLFRNLKKTFDILTRLHVPAIAPVLNWGGGKQKPWFVKYVEKLPTRLQQISLPQL